MLIEKNIQHILNQLVEGNSVKVPFDGLNITVGIVDDSTKLSLSAPIYEGENYMPKSVRGCLSLKSPFLNSSIRDKRCQQLV